MLKSKPFALAMLLVTLALTVLIFILCPTWYWFCTIFLAYMTCFCHMCSLMFGTMSPRAAGILHKTAVVCLCFAAVSVIVSIIMMLG